MRRMLRAGPLRAELEAGDLRYARVGALEIVRRLYFAVRDENWSTIPTEFVDLEVDAEDDRFEVRFNAHNRRDEIDFRWRGELTGTPDGVITYSMTGMAERDFRYNRIGLCIHHAPRETAGRPYRGTAPSGPITGTLPRLVGPQRIEDGRIFPLFAAFDSLALELNDSREVRFDFEGDLFEMEDQRNWTDSSFKTYSTPLELGVPHRAQRGQTIEQKVTISIEQKVTISPPRRWTEPRPAEAPRLRLGEAFDRTLPPIGLGGVSLHDLLSDREARLLSGLRAAHIRVDLHLQDASWKRDLERTAQACARLETSLELALFLTDAAESELTLLASALETVDAPVVRALIFHQAERVTSARWIQRARIRLSSLARETAFVGGTNGDFADLNRNRPDVEGMDAVAYSITPQFHASDEASLVENLEAQADTVRTARAFLGDLPSVISPITLKPRSTPVMTDDAPDRLPPQVDPRQMSLFGAAWTLGSVKYLAESGASSLTYFKTTGWQGVMEKEAGPALPDSFPSASGMVFPLYHVLADLAESHDHVLVEARPSDPLLVNGLALESEHGRRALVANMTPGRQHVTIGPLDAELVSIRRLDEHSAELAMLEPDRFRTIFSIERAVEGHVDLELAPYEFIRVEEAG